VIGFLPVHLHRPRVGGAPTGCYTMPSGRAPHRSRSSACFVPPVAETETERGLIRPRQTGVLMQRVLLGRVIEVRYVLACSFQSALHRRGVGGGDRGWELT
jgi:hypothetical protein